MRSRAVEDARPVDIDLVVVICNEKLPWLTSFFAPPNLAPSVQARRCGYDRYADLYKARCIRNIV